MNRYLNWFPQVSVKPRRNSYEQLWLEQGNEKTKHTFEIARMEDDLKKMFRSLQLTDTKRQISHHCSPS